MNKKLKLYSNLLPTILKYFWEKGADLGKEINCDEII